MRECVAPPRHGGGAPLTRGAWLWQAEGILKYAHNDAIQALVYAPHPPQAPEGLEAVVGLRCRPMRGSRCHRGCSTNRRA